MNCEETARSLADCALQILDHGLIAPGPAVDGLDWSHIQRSSGHTGAAIQRLRDGGRRAVFGTRIRRPMTADTMK